ncbi:circadian-associated transcriptional repressor-like [Lampris incognitus]|uniref:circadian-associated transcriptional repressor-like n=1 Tax=Lampris incognitus TaxID=2546036 RepID=UPI0024B596D4|nr:circadian-associated transcriptional repressor-like [Lampris incognitus]
MQSQGSTSSQPSLDSLSSNDSFLFSDSEPAEDDADVFLTDGSPSVVMDRRGAAAADMGGRSESPGSQWACDGFTDKEEEEESDRSESSGGARRGAEERADAAGQSAKSQGDLLFAQKCAELQGFVRPLLELLNGLKKGRFDRGLSSFQQSVAMDRIQRIVGVLQRPNCGEKYLNTLLQVEMMLKLWFPQISTHPAPMAATTATPSNLSPQDIPCSTPPHKHRDQSHIPVKKRRLSWTDTDSPTPSPVLLKQPRTDGEEKGKQNDHERGGPPPALLSDALRSPQDAARDSPPEDERKKERGESSYYKTSHCSEASLTWVHVAPILSPPKACAPHKGTAAPGNGENQPVAAIPPPASRGGPATQDSAISSTTPQKHPKNQKKPIQCQSQPVAGLQTETKTIETCQGQSPPVKVRLLSRVCPAPLET